ncbi:MAG: NAD(P)H-quinone oxidoreductase [Myxococcota bacterium]
MKAVFYRGAGGPEVIRLEERPAPVPGPDEVLIRVAGAGVNRPDIIQRRGFYPPPPGVTEVPGLEVSGAVEAIGTRVTEWKPGDRVAALVAGGGYAELCVAPEGQCLPVPEAQTLVDAAALIETSFTVWAHLFGRGRLQPGERLLVHGGASGIGTTAIQMAKLWGCTVAVTAGTDERCQACLELGADQAINYRTQRSTDVLGESSMDVVLDMVGGEILNENLKVLAPEGRHVSIAFLGGQDAKIDVKLVMTKRLVLTGATLRARPEPFKRGLRDEIRERLWPWFEEGALRPVISHRLKLAAAAEAQQILERSEHFGKVVLLCR